MKRELDQEFIKDLNNGILSELLTYVKKNVELIVEIRGNYINIYYHGGMVLRVSPKRQRAYLFAWNKKYAPNDKMLHSKIDDLKYVRSATDSKKWIALIPNLIGRMDEWFSTHPKKEKFIQQEIVKTDAIKGYLITDFEYQKGNKARFDLMGVNAIEEKPILSFIELKQGYNSLRTRVNGSKKTSGLKKHLEDIITEIRKESDVENEIAQAKCLFNQKVTLGLLPKSDFPNEIRRDQIEVLFVIVDYKTSGSTKLSTQLKSEITDIETFLKTYTGKIKLNLKIMLVKSNLDGNTISLKRVSNIVDYTRYDILLRDFYNLSVS